MIALEDFVDDKPWTPDPEELADVRIEGQIDGVVLRRLVTPSDGRGDLTVLMSQRHGADLQTPHVYLVTVAQGSVRAWVYHKRQSDRLAFTQGLLRVVLIDLRTESPTYQAVNVIDVGASNKVLLTIPPFVVHAVQGLGHTDAQFVNMPTRAYDPADPDKSRVPKDHPGIPYTFE